MEEAGGGGGNTNTNTNRDETHLILRVLQLLKQASHDLQTNPTTALRNDSSTDTPDSAAIKALLELEHESDSILSSDPNLSQLSVHLSSLKSLIDSLPSTTAKHQLNHFGLRSFLRTRASAHKIARVAGSIESEIQAWIDRESLERLVNSLDSFSIQSNDKSGDEDEDNNNSDERERELINQLDQFGERVSQGFSRELQHLVLKSKVFTKLESVLCNTTTTHCSNTLREHCAFTIESLIRFNKNVFVGQVLMGPTVQSLIRMGTLSTLRVLCSLIRSIKSPIVDEIESYGMIPDIILLLSSSEVEIRVLGLDCVLEIGYFGRKEAVEAMIGEGLIGKLVELQMSELGGDLIDVGRCVEEREMISSADDDEIVESDGSGNYSHNSRSGGSRERYLKDHPFASCVARFAVQLEVGEGLRKREKRALKQEVLRRVKEDASLSDAQAATIAAEVLWGASP